MAYGTYRRFDGKEYKLKASSDKKSDLRKLQKRWGWGRIVPLPKSHPDKYGLFTPA